MADTYVTEEGIEAIDKEGEAMVERQWNNLVSSLTNDQKKKIQGPIEWERIHNLPDHVYFNHSQHVAVGKLECQNCHGAVEEMDVLAQHAPLSMGWCINCHNETEVQMADNGYYDEIHARMTKSGDRGEELLKEYLEDGVITAKELGGWECSKCHY